MNIENLPKWAQKHINDIQRERDAAVRALDEYTDTQTPTPWSTFDYVCDGKERGPTARVAYWNKGGSSMEVVHAGVSLRVTLRDGAICLQWGESEDMRKRGETPVALVPESYMSARLVPVRGADK